MFNWTISNAEKAAPAEFRSSVPLEEQRWQAPLVTFGFFSQQMRWDKWTVAWFFSAFLLSHSRTHKKNCERMYSAYVSLGQATMTFLIHTLQSAHMTKGNRLRYSVPFADFLQSFSSSYSSFATPGACSNAAGRKCSAVQLVYVVQCTIRYYESWKAWVWPCAQLLLSDTKSNVWDRRVESESSRIPRCKCTYWIRIVSPISSHLKRMRSSVATYRDRDRIKRSPSGGSLASRIIHEWVCVNEIHGDSM